MEFQAWLKLMDKWGLEANQVTFDALVAAYQEEGRFYHTQAHVDACLKHLEAFHSKADHPHEIEMALWFHDAVYKPLSSQNERKSADWARAFLLAAGAEEGAASRVHQLIMATEHKLPTKTTDESILNDIDLAILGAEPAEYDLFEKNVRREYWMMPWPTYKRGRAKLLENFLNQPGIFENEPFVSEREHRARKNVYSAILRLE